MTKSLQNHPIDGSTVAPTHVRQFKTTPPSAPALLGHVAAAYEDLMEGIGKAVNTGRPVPCLGPHWDAWTSGDKELQDAAAEACITCPVLGTCGAYARDAKERGGVWGGKLRRPLTSKKRTPSTDTTTGRSY